MDALVVVMTSKLKTEDSSRIFLKERERCWETSSISPSDHSLPFFFVADEFHPPLSPFSVSCAHSCVQYVQYDTTSCSLLHHVGSESGPLFTKTSLRLRLSVPQLPTFTLSSRFLFFPFPVRSALTSFFIIR